MTAIMMLLSMVAPAQAANERRLKFYFTHTKERIDIVYKRNGRYIPSALKKLNRFLRDWRQDQSTKMDPRLLDLIWSVYQQMDTREAIHIVSAFRAPKTNNMLRRRGRGVAKNSQHTRGKAMDFFIPGVNLAKLRATGLRMEVGGVGYYPTSGSPFVHMDTGSVRHWPRMTEKQLAKVFPRGDTTQVPSNGKRQKRYNESLARQKRIVSAEISPPNQRRGGVFARVFNRDQSPATIPTTGQSLSSGNVNSANAAPPINVIPRLKPDGAPTELLPETQVQVAQTNAPPPRPMPAAQIVLSAAPTTEPNLAKVPEDITSEVSGRAVASAWSQVGDTHSTDVSKMVLTAVKDNPDKGAPDVAKAVVAALNTTRTQAGQIPRDTAINTQGRSPSAAASIAAAILTPTRGETVRRSRDFNSGSLVAAYAPSAPTPSVRPAFNAALGFSDDDDTANGRPKGPVGQGLAEEMRQTTDAFVEEPRIPGIPPRPRPQKTQIAALNERPKPVASSARRASLSGQVPASALRKNNAGLEFHGGDQSVLASMTTPETTRSEVFANFAMPNPYKMPEVFQVPIAIVENNFTISSTTLRTDKFSGKAIVATKLARLANR